ncbi:MAG: 16S rRNA (guanine(527)-N(7))-methyltransferase RsmG, partial [Bacteroidales bacterium]|nr:16S rRNA (guanine(527)-N(7))-methyltransferase RsmG [Bacteroidales bacterium]
RKDMDEFYLHHVLHSLAIAKVLGPVDGAKVLDLGCGGGFPGIPLAVFFPQMHFILCDSIRKKTLVASEVASALKLDNVTVVNARAETLPETYDFVVSRAVTSLDNFLPWVKGKYKDRIVYLKGGDVNEELAAAAVRCGLNLKKVSVINISDFFKEEWFSEKRIVVIRK